MPAVLLRRLWKPDESVAWVFYRKEHFVCLLEPLSAGDYPYVSIAQANNAGMSPASVMYSFVLSLPEYIDNMSAVPSMVVENITAPPDCVMRTTTSFRLSVPAACHDSSAFARFHVFFG